MQTVQRLDQIERNVDSIEKEKQKINQKIENLLLKIDENKTYIEERYGRLSILKSDLADITSVIEKLSVSDNRYADIRTRLEARISKG